MRKLIFALIMASLSNTVLAQIPAKKSIDEVDTEELVQKREIIKRDVVSRYLATKDGLMASDGIGTAKAASKLADALTKLKFKKIPIQEMSMATATREKIKSLANNIASTQSINKQRKFMIKLSEEMWTIIDKIVPGKTVLYQQRCIIKGRSWISAEKEIKNPYNPKDRITCGEITASVGTVDQ